VRWRGCCKRTPRLTSECTTSWHSPPPSSFLFLPHPFSLSPTSHTV
jgi:hypothetical protein